MPRAHSALSAIVLDNGRSFKSSERVIRFQDFLGMVNLMKRIFVPTQSHNDWRRLLAWPDRQWRTGASAMALARAWEAAWQDGFPPEIGAMFAGANLCVFSDLTLVLGIPEYKVHLPGGSRPSQTDMFALARGKQGLIAIAMEGKVDEAFGPKVGKKREKRSKGIEERLHYIVRCLDLSYPPPDSIRYQLLHRTASALEIGKQFCAPTAVMIVHSFSPSAKGFEDFCEFAKLFGVCPDKGQLAEVGDREGIRLFIGWCCGDQRFREAGELD